MQTDLAIASIIVLLLVARAAAPEAKPSSTVAATIEGTAMAKDGDGVLFGQIEIRLNRI